MSDADAVWAETTDGGLLKQLFGSYPTLHDALVVSIEMDRASDTAQITVDYEDVSDEDDTQLLSARIRLEWQGVEALEIPLGYDDMFGLSFRRSGDKIRTDIEMWPGIFGYVISDTVEAVLIQLDPGDPAGPPVLRYR